MNNWYKKAQNYDRLGHDWDGIPDTVLFLVGPDMRVKYEEAQPGSETGIGNIQTHQERFGHDYRNSLISGRIRTDLNQGTINVNASPAMMRYTIKAIEALQKSFPKIDFRVYGPNFSSVGIPIDQFFANVY